MRQNPTWHIPGAVLDAIRAHAEAASPDECCGLLLGRDGRVEAHHAAANAADRPRTRYTIDPRDHFAAIRRARDRGLEVVGAYHSHPTSAAVPSARDMEDAFERFLFVIVSLVESPPDVRAWTFDAGNFVQVGLVRTG